MIENDTVRLLRECDEGVKMGISSLEDVMGYTRNPKLRQLLKSCADKHRILDKDITEQLRACHDRGKQPPEIAKRMSSLKTNVKLAMNCTDEKISDIITDGCNMGIKSLTKYLNAYEAADEKSKDVAKRLINIEEKLMYKLREFL